MLAEGLRHGKKSNLTLPFIGTSEGAILVWNIITQSILCSHTFPDGNTILRCSRIDDSHFITHSRGSPVVVWHLDNSSLTHLLGMY